MQTFLEILILIGVTYLWYYLKEKGKNQATKEDIEGITRNIETIKASIGSKLYVHQLRYQNEFDILKKLSEQLVELRDSLLALRPIIDSTPVGKSDGEVKEEKLKRCQRAFLSFYKDREINKPFYPEELYAALRDFDKLGWKEAVAYSEYHPWQESGILFKDYWDEATKNSATIVEQSNGIIVLIRKRIKEWENFK